MKNWIKLAVFLPLLACARAEDAGPPLVRDMLENQPVSRTSERPPPFARHIAQSRSVGLGGGIAGFLIGKAVSETLNADEQARSRIGEVPTPQDVDPGQIIENMIADHLVAHFGARPNLRSFYAGSVRETASAERGPKVAELARLRGLSGVVVDVVALEFYADSTGRNLGLSNEAFRIVVTAEMNLVDIDSGAVLASGSCTGSHANVQPVSAAVEDGARLTTLLAQKAAADCAVQLVSKDLR